jgi:PWI domain
MSEELQVGIFDISFFRATDRSGFQNKQPVNVKMSFVPPPPVLGLPPPGSIPLPSPPPPLPPASAARPNQLLFLHVPSCLHNVRTIRDWIMSVGGTRSVLLIPPAPKAGDAPVLDPITALATMSNPDVALRVFTAFRYMSTTYKDEDWQDFSVHFVPTHPDIPMPPAFMDPESVQIAGDTLYKAFKRYKDGNVGDVNAVNSEAASTDRNETTDPSAKAGDEEGLDPLESPAVLEAVRKFREHLTVLQGSKATKRQKLVADAIAKELPIMRQRIAEERAAAMVSQVPPMFVPPPPPPAVGIPVPPLMLNAPRGVSNQPAWMTKKEDSNTQPAGDEPPAKKVKLDVSNPLLSFPSIPPQQTSALRQFISDRIKHYLGEEEASLIDFVYNHVVQGNKTVSALIPELTDVLDEDATPFLESIYDYCHEF